MTTLRDDGYLETNDPLVAACFLGREVVLAFDEDWDDPITFPLYAVSNHGVTILEDAEYTYPMRVPANTVKEVMGTELDMHCIEQSVVEQHLVTEGWPDEALMYWVREHTEES